MMVKQTSALIIFIFTTLSICSTQKSATNLEILIGNWKIEHKDTFETWKKVDETKLEGKSYKLNNGEEKISETLSIIKNQDNIIYKATVPNQNNGQTISFALNTDLANIISFENMVHDFPKKIQYKIINQNKLLVNVLGEDDKGFSYHLIRQ